VDGIKVLALVILVAGGCTAQTADSLSARKSPRRAALYALAFPGGGQIYNGRYLKAGLILGLEGLAYWRFAVNRKLYRGYQEDYALPRHRYLEKRNKYAWWVAFIYVYGLLDAVVDAHLQTFNAVMSEDLEHSGTQVTEQQEEP
jgi:hypothetical protein